MLHFFFKFAEFIVNFLLDVNIDGISELADEIHLKGESVVVWLQTFEVFFREVIHIVLIEVLEHLVQVLDERDFGFLFLASKHLATTSFYFKLIITIIFCMLIL